MPIFHDDLHVYEFFKMSHIHFCMIFIQCWLCSLKESQTIINDNIYLSKPYVYIWGPMHN